MQLLVIRHAIAEERDVFSLTGAEDAMRPLTDTGRRKMERAAQGLRRVVDRIDLLATSPLVRAEQTSAIVAEEFGGLIAVPVPELAPGTAPQAFCSWLRRQEGAEVIAVVGHEPDLGSLVTWFLTGTANACVPLRKGGAVLLDFAGRPDRGAGTLRVAVTPSLLRRLAD